MSLDPKADQQISVVIEGAAAQVTKKFYFANDMAEGFGIDKSKIPDLDGDAVVEKIVEGPPGFQGLWNVCLVMMAFAPNLYSRPDAAKRALAEISIADYPSRKEVYMKNKFVSLLKICTTKNICTVPPRCGTVQIFFVVLIFSTLY